MYDISAKKSLKGFPLQSYITTFTENHVDTYSYIAARCLDGSLNLVTLVQGVSNNMVLVPMMASMCRGKRIPSVKYSSEQVTCYYINCEV